MDRNLCIDIGNTRWHWATFEANKMLQFGADLPAKADLISVESVIVSNVGQADIQELEDKLSLSVIELNHKTKLPIRINYNTPESLGPDRLAAAVGLFAAFPGEAAMSVDLGTCITYDIIDANGTYHGGAISPGLEMRSKAMHQHTAKLPEVQIEFPPNFMGDSTQHALQSGVMYGVQYEIEGMIEAVKARFGEIKVVLTGGNASSFAEVIKNHIFADPNLVLKGLNEILNYNRA